MGQDFNDPDIQDPRPESPIVPVRLALDDRFRFHCHPGIACFNKCCENINIMLTPYDLLRLKNRLGLSSREFIERHAVIFEMDAHGMPGLQMKTREGSSACQFLTPQGCGVYEDRPAACRYYALGATTLRPKDSPVEEEFYFVVKEPHCLGHLEPKTQTIAEYRREQHVDVYDDLSREWRRVVLKKRSSGPTVGRPSERSLQLFFLASYDLDHFRVFVASPWFREVYDIPEEEMSRLLTDELALLAFAARYLKQVLYGEKTIPERPGAIAKRIARRQEINAHQREPVRQTIEQGPQAPDGQPRDPGEE